MINTTNRCRGNEPTPERVRTAKRNRYCLANPGQEYLVYQPRKAAQFSLELKAGRYRVEWFNPSTGATVTADAIEAGDGAREFKPPFTEDAVLYLDGRR